MAVGFDSAHIKNYRLGIHEGVDEKVDYPRCISDLGLLLVFAGSMLSLETKAASLFNGIITGSMK